MHQHLRANLREKRADSLRIHNKSKIKKTKTKKPPLVCWYVFVYVYLWHKTELRVKNQAQFRHCDGFLCLCVVSLSGLQDQCVFWLHCSKFAAIHPSPAYCICSLSPCLNPLIFARISVIAYSSEFLLSFSLSVFHPIFCILLCILPITAN